jgi:hypothetical protein
MVIVTTTYGYMTADNFVWLMQALGEIGPYPRLHRAILEAEAYQERMKKHRKTAEEYEAFLAREFGV